jgi:hypothetical protein
MDANEDAVKLKRRNALHAMLEKRLMSIVDLILKPLDAQDLAAEL